MLGLIFILESPILGNYLINMKVYRGTDKAPESTVLFGVGGIRQIMKP